MKIYKDNKENVIISLTKEENETITNALKTAVEELDLVKKGEAVTATDREYAENALKGLSVLHDVYTPDNTIADIAKRYAEPAVYYVGSREYDELNNMPFPMWEAFLDELARYGLTCSYCNVYDTFTIG